MRNDWDVDLPFVDWIALTIDTPRERVWPALERFAERRLQTPQGGVLRTVLKTEPRTGFALEERVPGERLAFTGRHRFARYRLVFALEDRGTRTRLSAATYAAFPGLKGRLYRALVIGSGAHVVATQRMLRAVARRAAYG